MDTSKPLTIDRLLHASDAEFETINTRHLLSLYRDFCRCSGHNWRNYERGWHALDTRYEPVLRRMKAELDKRPHVPNKLESKALRQQQAKQKR